MSFVGDNVKGFADDAGQINEVGIRYVTNKSSRLYRVTESMDFITSATEVCDTEGRASHVRNVAEQTGTVLASGMQTYRWLAPSNTCYAASSTAEVEPSSRAAKFFNSSPVICEVLPRTVTSSMIRLFSCVAVVGLGT